MKHIFLLLLSSVFFLLSPNKVFAEEKLFDVKIEGTYVVNEEGITDTTLKFALQNLTDTYVSDGYILKMRNIDPQNLTVTEKGEPIQGAFKKLDSEITEIKLTFTKLAAGKGTVRNFEIHFLDQSFAKKTGEIWEVELPRFEDSLIAQVSAYVVVPRLFGDEAFVSPESIFKKEKGNSFEYGFENINAKTPIKLGFGPFQTFRFSLNYHLQNNEGKSREISFALPPDTTTQRMHYELITPMPKSIQSDRDGNWIAKINVSGKSTQTVSVSGTVQILSDARKPFSKDPSYLLSMTKPTQYWQSEDEALKKIATELKTPEKIFQYVSKTLTYNRTKASPGSTRLGALQALEDKNNAICTEFTDLFVALSRSAGIPARAINGYAYTQNPETEPLSLVSDVLHSWAEYWDSSKNTWVPVDPTWSSTSNQDYFTKLDMRHFAFSIHGISDVEPLPAGAYKSDDLGKDVFVELGKSESSGQGKPLIETIEKVDMFPFNGQLTISIKNPNGYAFESEELRVLIDNSLFVNEYIPIIPSFGEYTKTIPIHYGPFGIKSPQNVHIQTTSETKSFDTLKSKSILVQIIIIFTIMVLLLSGMIITFLRPKLFRRLLWMKR